MSSYPLIKFVDAPTVAATVRYDCNDQAGTPSKKVTEFDPGVPTLEGDPDAVGQQWGFRSPSITHTIKGTKAQAMAALSAVSKEQLRRTNWVMFQLSAATSPRWFKTYRTGYQAVTLDRVYVRVDGGGQAPLPDTWKITIPLVAEAFTYGVREVISTTTIVQNSTGTNPMRLVLPTIKGDAPTGLRVAVTPGSTLNSDIDCAWMVACLSGKSTMSDPVFNIGGSDGLTAWVTTSASVTNAAYFSGNYRTVTVAANDGAVGGPDGTFPGNVAVRLTGPLPVVPRGRYKAWLRCEADYSGSLIDKTTYLFQLGQTLSGTPTIYALPAQQVVLTGSTFQGWVDLGDFNFPFGVSAPADSAATVAAPVISLRIGNAENISGVVRVDAIKLVPIDGPTVTAVTMLKSKFARSPLRKLVTGTFDSDSELYSAVNGSNVFYEGVPALKGGFPVADPAAEQNLLLLMATDRGYSPGSAPHITNLDAAAAVDVSYHPRYLHVGDGT